MGIPKSIKDYAAILCFHPISRRVFICLSSKAIWQILGMPDGWELGKIRKKIEKWENQKNWKNWSGNSKRRKRWDDAWVWLDPKYLDGKSRGSLWSSAHSRGSSSPIPAWIILGMG